MRKLNLPTREDFFSSERMDVIKSLAELKRVTSYEDVVIIRIEKHSNFLPANIFSRLNNLQELSLSNNLLVKLAPNQFAGLNNLQMLSLSGNHLTQLAPEQFAGLNNLQTLLLSHNQLIRLAPEQFSGLSNLQTLSLSHNQLIRLAPEQFSGLSNLQTLYLSDNKLTQLAPEQFSGLSNLQTLYLSDNNLTELVPEQFAGLVNLQTLILSDNNLTELPIQLTELRNLIYFFYSNNPIEYLPPQLQRFLDHLNQANRQGQEVYNDAQSVHNSSIQRTFIESVNRLTQGKPDLTFELTLEEIIASKLSQACIEGLIQYAQSPEIHSVINLNFGELLVSVWDRIRISPHKENIFTVLNQEILDSECKCFTGRITRLVNCLSGFDDDVRIEISETEQLANIATLARKKFFTLEEQKDYFTAQARERSFPQEIIDVWLDGF